MPRSRTRQMFCYHVKLGLERAFLLYLLVDQSFDLLPLEINLCCLIIKVVLYPLILLPIRGYHPTQLVYLRHCLYLLLCFIPILLEASLVLHIFQKLHPCSILIVQSGRHILGRMTTRHVL